MSSSRSSSNGEGLHSSRCGQRTPLRSLGNETLHPSTLSSRFKSKSLLDDDVVKTKKQDDVPICDQCPPSTKVQQSNPSAIDMTTTETHCGLGDVTFKSFVCPGGEVEITGSPACGEESIILPRDQAKEIPCETEDTIISDSTIVESCGDHNEHPYYNPEMKDASLVDIDAAHRADQNDCSGTMDVTWKSFVCDGGEVEVSDITRIQDETIPLPQAQLGETLQDNVKNSTNLSDCSQQCPVEDSDHRYCSRRNDITDFTETTSGSEKPAGGPNEVTFRTFNCSGGEIEVLDGTNIAEETTVPLPADQTATCGGSYSPDIAPSMFAGDQDVQTGSDNLDHPYCHFENDPSTPSGDLPRIQDETIPLPQAQLGETLQDDVVNSTNLSDCSQICPVEVSDSPCCSRGNDITDFTETTSGSEKPAGGPNNVTFRTFNCSGGEIEVLDGTKIAEETTVTLPADQTATCGGSYSPDIDPSMFAADQDVQTGSDNLDHPYCHFENDPSTPSGDLPRIQDETIPLPKAQLGETLQDDVVNSTNLSDCSQQCPVEDSDHRYCSRENDITDFTETTSGSEKPAGSPNDVTFRTFNCSGGEIEVLDGTNIAEETTAPLPADQTATCGGSYSPDRDPSMFAGDQDVQTGSDNLEHPYCHFENDPSTPSGDLPRIQDETIPLPKAQLGETLQDDVVNSTNLSDCSQICPVEDSDSPCCSRGNYITETTSGSEKPAGGPNNVTFRTFNCSGGEIEVLDGTNIAEETTVPLPADQTATCGGSYSPDIDPSMFAADQDVQTGSDNLDHPYCHFENDPSTPRGDLPMTPEPLTLSLNAVEEVEQIRLLIPASQSSRLDNIPYGSFINARSETEPPHDSLLFEKTMLLWAEHLGSPMPRPLLKSTALCCQPQPSPLTEPLEDVVVEPCTSPQFEPEKSILDAPSIPDENGDLPTTPEPLTFSLNAVEEVEQVRLLIPARQSSRLSAIPYDSFINARSEAEQAHDSQLLEKTMLFWAEHLGSPMPRPLFNSTALRCKPQPSPLTEPLEDVVVEPCTPPQFEPEKPTPDAPLIPDGPLQQQLRQMAEFLLLASGKMGLFPVSGPPAAITVPLATAPHAECQSVCVGTSPMKWADQSVNTSGQFERKREFSVVDSCTLTDPLLWNVPPGSLECLPRRELEQRLRTSMIMVEALVQQLSAASTHGCPSAGPAPSDLREKHVQTDHTELSQTTMHRDLYLEALSRIGELELDRSSLQNLIQRMQDMRVTMTSLSADTDGALSNMRQIGDIVGEDHQSLASHYGQMKSLLERTKETQTLMMQKVKDALHQRKDMRTQMEEAFTAKEAAFSAMEQLRTHCATEISELERVVGCQQQMRAALDQTYPAQVALNKAYTEILDSASDVLSTTLEEQSSLMKELDTVKGLLQKTAPMLLELNETAAAALRERDEHIAARDQAVEEREQIEEECNQANLDLQNAREQIGDLNLQVTILGTEMGVLRQKHTDREEEKGQLEWKVTELSATVSSSLASYTFLEQALASETTKLQQSRKDIQQAKDRVNELEESLGQSEQRVCELSRALAQSEEQLSQTLTLSHSQKLQIQQLQEVCTQLSGVREMNEFLQMENELARNQMDESECMLRENLQALRERNIQCEDLKGERGQLQLDNRSLHKELESTRSRASAAQLELGEKLAQVVTEITLLHHTLRGLTDELNTALNEQTPGAQKDKESQSVHNLEPRHPSSSFVDSIIVALTAEKDEGFSTEAPPASSDEPQCEALFSETSAFKRVPVKPKKNLHAAELPPEEEEEQQSSVAELFSGLSSTVTELINVLKLLRQHKDGQLEEMNNTICSLQGEQRAANSRHEAEVLELKLQLSSLNSLVERGSQALQHKAQDEKTVTRLLSELQETQEILNKHKTDSNELRREVVELRRSFQQSKVESQCLRGELKKAGGGQSTNPAHFMEEKIHLLKEVERLKLSLQEAEQARVKLLDRAKRHQSIHQTNQQKSENELQMLNNVINKVRETLLSLPEAVKKCDQLQQLVDYIG